jgi:cell volume regulation protein A
MYSTTEVLLAGAVLTTLSVVASRVSGKLGVPALLLFLGIGMLAGSEGIGGIWFDDARATQTVAVVALIYILFAGGLQTRWEEARTVARGAAVLATVGVLATASAMGGFAWLVMGLDPIVALLLGSIVASTDAAAVFALFQGRGVRLKGRLRPLLEFESGSNDPMAVFLTTAMLGLLTEPDASLAGLVPAFLRQMVFGALVGFSIGHGAAWLINRIRLDVEGLYPVLTLALALIAYGLTELTGGNGFLGVYVAGLVLGSRPLMRKQSLLEFHDGVAWLMQIAMFLTLGLLVFPSHLLPVVGQGLAASLYLMFIARPLAVFLTLAPLDYTWREKTLVAWVGMRGAVPIVLATYPLLAGIPEAESMFNVIFFIVLTSALFQGTTIIPVARWLGLQDTEPASQPFDPRALGPVAGRLREVVIPEGSPVDGRPIVDLGVPRQALILLVFRGPEFVLPRGATRLQGGDRLLVLAEEAALGELVARLRGSVPAPAPESVVSEEVGT